MSSVSLINISMQVFTHDIGLFATAFHTVLLFNIYFKQTVSIYTRLNSSQPKAKKRAAYNLVIRSGVAIQRSEVAPSYTLEINK